MPADSDPKSTGDSQNHIQGWLSRCGIIIPSLSVRDSDTSDIIPNKPVMVVANPKEKKRKRTAQSPLAAARTPFKMAESHPQETAKQRQQSAKDAFQTLVEYLTTQEQEEANAPPKREYRTRGHTSEAPKPSPVTIYKKRREALVKLDYEESWDYLMKREASALEKKAAIIIRVLREFERRVVFGNNASEAIPHDDALDMGGQFLTNKSRIEQQSKLFEIAAEVPKGAILHLHFNAELNPEQLLQEARKMSNMYVWSIMPLDSENALEITEMIFNVMEEDTNSVDIFDSNYEGRENNWKSVELKQRVWMRWEDFRKRFQEKYPGLYVQTKAERNAKRRLRTCSEPEELDLDPAENWIKQKMVLSEEEAYSPKQTVNGVWARFNQATRCFKGLLNYKRVYSWYIGNAIDRMIDEGVMYAELRPMLLDKSIPDDNGKDRIDNASQMRMILEAVEAKKAQLEAEGRGHLFPFGLKIIYCTPRSIPTKMMQAEMRDCIDLKIQFPDLICGFDLVGAEDRPNHIGFYYHELVAFQETCKAQKLDIPFLFHAGETLLDTGGSTDPSNSNLYDAVLLKSKRIGHGFSLMKHPELLKYFRRGPLPKDEYDEGDKGQPIENPGICIELCPISNELLHLCRNIKEHPYPELLAAGIPCTVNSDNPSLFSNSMSHEFYQVMVGTPTMSLFSWKQLALWSLEYSCLNEDQKATGRRYFLEAWKVFCDYVVKTYGHLVVGDSIDEEAAIREYGITQKV